MKVYRVHGLDFPTMARARAYVRQQDLAAWVQRQLERAPALTDQQVRDLRALLRSKR